MIKIPSTIRSVIGDKRYILDDIGKANSKILCFDDFVLKIEKETEESNNEHTMMDWLNKRLCVPKVLHFEKSGGFNFLLMTKIKGKMLCAEQYLLNPIKTARILSKALKMMWCIDISECPSNQLIDNKLRLAEIRVSNNLCVMDDSEAAYGANGFQSPQQLLEWLKRNKPSETPVFSHGDFCLPNLFANHDEISGFIDLGRSGVADKYQDIALCYRSLKSNILKMRNSRAEVDEASNLFFNELGVTPNWNLIKYYILLDELF